MADISYYDIDDCLAEAEMIPCVFRVEAFELGYLDDGSEEEDVALPFWLARKLYRRDEPLIECQLPAVYGPRYKASITADPTVLNLSERCPYYYELGLKLHQLVKDPDTLLMMQQAFQMRYLEILKKSAQSRNTDFSQFKARLSMLEFSLLETKLRSNSAMQLWTRRQAHRLTSAQPLISASSLRSASGSGAGADGDASMDQGPGIGSSSAAPAGGWGLGLGSEGSRKRPRS